MAQAKSTKTHAIPTRLIAPCGMNCRLCYAFIRDKKPCPGCLEDDVHKSNACVTCRIRNVLWIDQLQSRQEKPSCPRRLCPAGACQTYV